MVANRILRKLVTQIFQRESKTRRKHRGIRNRFRHIMKKSRHLCRCLQITIGILRDEAAGSFQRPMIPNAGEHIEDLALFRQSVTSAIRCQQWKLKRFGKSDRLLIDRFLCANVMAL